MALICRYSSGLMVFTLNNGSLYMCVSKSKAKLDTGCVLDTKIAVKECYNCARYGQRPSLHAFIGTPKGLTNTRKIPHKGGPTTDICLSTGAGFYMLQLHMQSSMAHAGEKQ